MVFGFLTRNVLKVGFASAQGAGKALGRRGGRREKREKREERKGEKGKKEGKRGEGKGRRRAEEEGEGG